MPPEPSLLDALLPHWDCNEVHARVIRAPAEAVWDALHATPLREARLAAPLMALRSLPKLLLGKRPGPSAGDLPGLQALAKIGFLPLAESPPRETVIGAVGQPWRPARNDPLRLADRVAFERFADPGYVRVAMNFTLEAHPRGTRLATETRILGTDAGATRKFKRYWLLIRMGSGAIRRSWLAAIARRAERG